MTSELIEFLSDANIYEKFLKHKAATSRFRHPYHFPYHTISSPKSINFIDTFQRTVQAHHISQNHEKDTVELICAGRQFKFNNAAYSILKHIFSALTFNKEDLLEIEQNMTWDDICCVLFPLIREGIIQPSTKENI